MSAFQRGREIRKQAMIARQEASQPEPVRSAILVLAVHKETKSQQVVGVAYSARGVGELLAIERSKYPGCAFVRVSTVLVQR